MTTHHHHHHHSLAKAEPALDRGGAEFIAHRVSAPVYRTSASASSEARTVPAQRVLSSESGSVASPSEAGSAADA